MAEPRPQAFVEKFTRVWSDPQPEEFAQLWAPEGQLLRPGMEEPIAQDRIPEWTITATFEGEQQTWQGVDRFTLDGDRATYGVAYFDTLPLLAAVEPSVPRVLEVASTRATAV